MEQEGVEHQDEGDSRSLVVLALVEVNRSLPTSLECGVENPEDKNLQHL